MKIKINSLSIGMIIYMYVAVIIFLAGWLKPIYALLSCAILCMGIYLGMRAWKKEETEAVYIAPRTMAIALVILIFLCWQTGIGAFTRQAGDWNKHNAVLHDLIEKRWPVIYCTEYGDSMLSYYIGYYLAPAVVGKITGSFRAAELTELILTMAGIWMVWVLLVHICRAETEKKQLFVLGILFLYGGMLALGQAVCGKLYPENYCFGSNDWMCPEPIVVQYTVNWFLLKWVPAQTIVPWIAIALALWKSHKVETYVMIGLPVLLYSGFAMVGIAVMMMALAIREMYVNGKETIRRIASPSNLILAIVIGGIFILYFWGNLAGEKPEMLGFHLLSYGKKKIFYFIFCFFMFGYYAILIFKERKKNMIYWVTVLSLCIYPRFRMGLYNDFAMRASIPALFVFMILVIRFLFECPYEKTEEKYYNLLIRKTLLAAGLAVGMIYPLLNIWEGIAKNDIGKVYRTDNYLTLEEYANPLDEEVSVDLRYNYYSYDLEHDWFYYYLAK